MAPTSTKHGTNLAQGGGNGYQHIDRNMYKKQRKRKTLNKNIYIFAFIVRRTAGRQPILYENK